MILQFVINGLITGILYSLLAIGFALIYNTTKIFHIATVALYVVAAYAFYSFFSIAGFSLWAAFLLALLVTMLASLIVEFVIYRPLKNKKASANVVMISSIGVMTVLVNLVILFWGNETKVIDNVIQKTWTLGNIVLTMPQVYQLLFGVPAIVTFVFFIYKSRWGIRFRALSSDYVLFEALGYRINRLRSILFLLSGLFIALASCLTVYDTGLSPHMGMNMLVNAMVAMIIGGMGRFNACIVGGLILGVIQSVVVYEFASNWQNAISFLILLLFLFFLPEGIMGYRQRVI